MRRFDAVSLEVQLRSLPPGASAAFALACAIRLSGSAPTPHLLAARARAIVLASLGEPFHATAAAESVLGELESSPQLDRDDVAGSYFALAHLVRNEPKAALWAAQRAYEAADTVAQGTVEFSNFTPGVEAVLLGCPLVQIELSHQARDLEQLRTNPEQFMAVVTRAGRT